jgi:glutathione S-transferase
LIARAQGLLGPTLRTLSARPFVFGDTPTLADAALYGTCAMLEGSDPALLGRISPELVTFARRVEEHAQGVTVA